MPGSQREVQNAEEEGVVFEWLSAPKGFVGDPVTGVMVQKMRLGAPDATGRQAPEVDVVHLRLNGRQLLKALQPLRRNGQVRAAPVRRVLRLFDEVFPDQLVRLVGYKRTALVEMPGSTMKSLINTI